MKQNALAKRAKLPQSSVNEFLHAQKPLATMTFMDRLLRVFDYSLSEALGQTMLPAKPLTPPAISRALVLEIAAEIEDWPDEDLRNWLAIVRGYRPARVKKSR